jgi:gamma-glutamyl:cysteine ligase YbdK (ATP-grasp superfamily)
MPLFHSFINPMQGLSGKRWGRIELLIMDLRIDVQGLVALVSVHHALLGPMLLKVPVLAQPDMI